MSSPSAGPAADIFRAVADRPLKLSALAAELKQKSKQLKPLLDAEVEAGRLHLWSKDLYCALEPQAVVRPRLERLTSTGAVKGKDLAKRAALEAPPIPEAIVKKHLKLWLEAAVREGRLYQWDKDSYAAADPRPVARERLLAIAAAELLSGDDLVKRAGLPVGATLLKTVRGELLREGLLRELAVPKQKKKVVVNTAHPEPYLEQAIARLLDEFGFSCPPESIRAMLARPATAPPASVQQVAQVLYDAMNRLAFSPGSSVTFYRLRQLPELAAVPKATFDKAALLLQEERRVLLAVHDHASRLPQAEQDQLVTDGQGAFYVSIYARRD